MAKKERDDAYYSEQEAKFAEALRQKEAENPENFQQEQEQEVEDAPSIMISEQFSQRYKKDEKGNVVGINEEEEFGKVHQLSELHPANDLGYKNLPLETLPSQGLFYPIDAKVTIKSASKEEIMQWSTIDESDYIDQVDKLNFVLERCCRVRSSSPGFSSWKDLAEIDRFFIVYRIKEFTFPNGENDLLIKFKCSEGCGYKTQVPLSSEHMRNFVQLTDDVMKYYDNSKRCFFVHSEKMNTDIELHMPTVGGMIAVTNEIRKAQQNGEDVDKGFTRILPFCIANWRNANEESINKLRRNSYTWPQNKFLFVSGLINKITECVHVECTCECERCGEVLRTPLFFRGGYTIKNLFAVSGELDDLI